MRRKTFLRQRYRQHPPRQRELLLLRVLRSVPVYVVAVNEFGVVTHVSTGAAGDESVLAPGFGETELGACYLGSLGSSAETGDPVAAQVLDGLKAVLSGERSFYTLEYAREVAGLSRSFLTRVDRVGEPTRGAVICHQDITQRSRAEAALREIHDRYAFATLAGGVGLWDLDLHTRKLYVDPSIVELLGYDRHAVGDSLQDWSSVTLRGDRQAVRKAALQCLRGDATDFEVEHRLIGRSGQTFWFLTRGHAVQGSDGRPGRLVGLSTNITARKETELATMRQREKYRQIFDGAGVAIWEADYTTVGRWLRRLRSRGLRDVAGYLQRHPEFVRRACAAVLVRDVNAEAIRLTGAGSKSVLQRLGLADLLLDPEPHFRNQLVALAEGRTTCESEVAIRTISGERRDLFMVTRFGGSRSDLDGVLLCAHEVTQLMERRRRYELATAAGGVTVFEFDLALRELRMDPPMHRLLGLGADQPVGLRELLVRIHPDDSPRVLSLERGLQADDAVRDENGNTPIPEFEFRLIDGRGRPRWFLKRGSVIRSANGRARKLVGTITDITDRKRMEQKVRRSHEQVRELVRRLIAAQEHEQARIARDLHEGLSAAMAQVVSGLTELGFLMGSDAPEATRREVARLESDLRELQGEIRTLSLEMYPALIESSELLPALQRLCADFASAQGVPVTFTADPAGDGASPDVTMSLYRVTLEALRNAAAHSGSPRVHVTVSARADSLELSIRDFGCGFDAADDRVYGLGLLGMQERARLAGGRAIIEAQPGHGTRVVVTVPFAPRPAPN